MLNHKAPVQFMGSQGLYVVATAGTSLVESKSVHFEVVLYPLGSIAFLRNKSLFFISITCTESEKYAVQKGLWHAQLMFE